MIEMILYVSNDEEYQDFLSSMEDKDFRKTLAMIQNDSERCELCAECGSLFNYVLKKESDGRFHLEDRICASDVLEESECFEELIGRVARLVL